MGLLLDPIPNSSNWHHYNCMEDSKENYIEILGVNGQKSLGKPYSYYLWLINVCVYLYLKTILWLLSLRKQDSKSLHKHLKKHMQSVTVDENFSKWFTWLYFTSGLSSILRCQIKKDPCQTTVIFILIFYKF